MAILNQSGRPIVLSKLSSDDASDPSLSQEDADWIWPQFCTVMWDSIGKGAARDLVSFREACHQLWTPFIQPAIDGVIRSRDFAKLIVKARPLLQGEDALLDDYSIQTRDKSGGLSRAIPKGNLDSLFCVTQANPGQPSKTYHTTQNTSSLLHTWPRITHHVLIPSTL